MPKTPQAHGVFEALGDATRRRMLELLAQGETTVGGLVAGLGDTATISQPAVSQHLKVLREAGLVNVRPEGTRRHYALDTAGLDVAHAWLSSVTDPLGAFAQPLDALETEIRRGRRERHRGRRPEGHRLMTS